MSEASDIRPGERAVDAPHPTDAGVVFIGHIQTPWKERKGCPRQGTLDGPVCQVIVDPRWEEALTGIERYETIEVLYWLHHSRRDLVLQNPKSDGRLFGTFALRSPVRPNPIGLSRVKLIARRGNILDVRGLDCLDGTPLVDIKPDRCAYSPKAPPKEKYQKS